ncbi:hypothetical protein HZS_6082 [Henneguya salminicola]|nr:hypothetical protein HZS_6082 [Henneguya salminicola]
MTGRCQYFFCMVLHELIALLDYDWSPSVVTVDFEKGLIGEILHGTLKKNEKIFTRQQRNLIRFSMCGFFYGNSKKNIKKKTRLVIYLVSIPVLAGINSGFIFSGLGHKDSTWNFANVDEDVRRNLANN